MTDFEHVKDLNRFTSPLNFNKANKNEDINLNSNISIQENCKSVLSPSNKSLISNTYNKKLQNNSFQNSPKEIIKTFHTESVLIKSTIINLKHIKNRFKTPRK